MERIIAVDFDGAITVSGDYAGRGIQHYADPNLVVVQFLRKKREEGWRIIIWTCRGEAEYPAILEYCRLNHIPYDGVNTNMFAPEAVQAQGSPKIYADLYLDDRAVHPKELEAGER